MMKQKNKIPLLLAWLAMLLFIGTSCEKVEGIINILEKPKQTREDLDEFNEKMKDLLETSRDLSQKWQGVLADSSKAKRDMISSSSAQWQQIVGSKGNMWRSQFGNKSEEWLQAAGEYKDLLEEWRMVADSSLIKLRALEREKPENVRLAISDVEVSLRGKIGVATTNFFCASDAMEVSLTHDLEMIWNRLGLAQAYTTQNELYLFTICSVSPALINLKASKEERNLLSISGYNFAATDGFSVKLIDANGISQILPPEAIDFLSSNEIRLNLNGIPDSILGLYQKLQIILEGQILSEVAIVR